MQIKMLHFYPDLMSLYGSYANGFALRRTLEAMGHSVTVETVRPGEDADLANADFLYMGAATERGQKAALADVLRFGDAVKAAAEQGVAMLFAGNAMELLGRRITDSDGNAYDGLGLAAFSTVQGTTRYVEDVYGHTDLFPEPVVGFMNKCGIISGVETPLLTGMDMGFGNEGPKSPEGFHRNNVFASELTGPILVKNPRLLAAVVSAILQRRGAALTDIPMDKWAEDGYTVTVEQLKARMG